MTPWSLSPRVTQLFSDEVSPATQIKFNDRELFSAAVAVSANFRSALLLHKTSIAFAVCALVSLILF